MISRNRRPLAALAIGLMMTLTGCGSGGNADVGGVTPGEARALNEAAAMLDKQAGSLAPHAAKAPAPVRNAP
jgi:hypothetical protein